MSNDTWATPPELFNALDKEFCFGFDVCAEDETAKCSEYWTVDQDALVQDWDIAGSASENGWTSFLWCNPLTATLSHG